MSTRKRYGPANPLSGRAAAFAALGDVHRLVLVDRLSSGEAMNIARLSEGFAVSRQAVTKHLRVLADAGLVHARREGREVLYALDLKPFKDNREYLAFVEAQWDQALARLQRYVEREGEE
ncbi:MAG: ArsR/SmtB family transcription factor [Candidatus Melainabacteria bacterium]